MLKAAFEPLQRLGLTFGEDLDAAVGRVPHPAENSFAPGGGFGEVSEADALHAAANYVSPRDDH